MCPPKQLTSETPACLVFLSIRIFINSVVVVVVVVCCCHPAGHAHGAGMSALMVRAPGESRIWSLDTMLPVVLGSLAGLLLAVQQPDGYGGGGGDGGDGGEVRSEDKPPRHPL